MSDPQHIGYILQKLLKPAEEKANHLSGIKVSHLSDLQLIRPEDFHEGFLKALLKEYYPTILPVSTDKPEDVSIAGSCWVLLLANQPTGLVAFRRSLRLKEMLYPQSRFEDGSVSSEPSEMDAGGKLPASRERYQSQLEAAPWVMTLVVDPAFRRKRLANSAFHLALEWATRASIGEIYFRLPAQENGGLYWLQQLGARYVLTEQGRIPFRVFVFNLSPIKSV